MTDTSLALGDARTETLEHGLALILESWRGFDHARPYQPPITDDIRALLSEDLPEAGVGSAPALDEVGEILDESLAHARPRFFGYVGSSGLELGVLADALAASHDINLAASAAAADLVERQTLRWVGDLVGFPRRRGAFTSGGMLSNLTALTAARERALPGSRLEGCDGRGVIYCERRGALERRARGRGARPGPAVAARDPDRLLPANAARGARGGHRARRRRRPRRRRRRRDRGHDAHGRGRPDPPVAEVCAAHGVWLHVDGAYGLPAAATPTAAPLFDGLELRRLGRARRAQVAVRAQGLRRAARARRSDLEAAFSHEAPYIPDIDLGEHPVDWTLEYSRPFRALKLWLALRAHGAVAFREAIEHDLELARLVADLVRAADDLELLVEPALSIVPFRRIPARGTSTSTTAGSSASCSATAACT